MSLSAVLFFFLVHLGIGIAFTLAVVKRTAGVKFFRFNAGLAAILIAVGFAFRPAAPESGSLFQAALGQALGLPESRVVLP